MQGLERMANRLLCRAIGMLRICTIAGGVAVLAPIGTASGQSNQAPGFVQQRYLQAAQAGNAKAQFSLGLLHEKGMIPSASPDAAQAQAMEWYEKAAGQGYVPAQFRLALLLQANGGDRSRIADLYEAAANQGMAEAQYNLSLILDRDGKLEEAARWMDMAAKQGLARAMRRMGILHLEGRGLPQDVVEAWIWLVRAVGAGDNESIILVSEIDALLSDEQRETAKSRLADEQN